MRAFTLVEMMVAVAILAVAAALAVPSVTSLVRLAHARSGAETVAAVLEEARTRAVNEGRCFRVRAPNASTLVVERLSTVDCVGNAPSTAAPFIDAFNAPVRTTNLGSGFTVTITDTAGMTSPNQIVFRPNSRLRGNGALTNTQYGARVVANVVHGPAFGIATITSLGRICLSTLTTAPPALTAPVVCP